MIKHIFFKYNQNFNIYKRALVSIGEANEAIASGKKLYLVIKLLKENTIIDNYVIDEPQRKDINRARIYLKDLAERHNIHVYEDIQECAEQIINDYCTQMEIFIIYYLFIVYNCI